MSHPETEILFPLAAIPGLRELRGGEWVNLVDRVSAEDASELEQLAFVQLMVRMAGCMTCNTDAYRAMKGCPQCSSQAVKRFRGTDEDLMREFEENMAAIAEYLEGEG